MKRGSHLSTQHTASTTLVHVKRVSILLLLGMQALIAQTNSTLRGVVTDQNRGAIPDAQVIVRRVATNAERIAQTDRSGIFQFAALPVGQYQVEVRSRNFKSQKIENLNIEVGRSIELEFRLEPGELSETVNVDPDGLLVERSSTSVGQLIDHRTIQDLPLNGRHFIDLGLLIPGSVTPPQNSPQAAPTRGLGPFALSTAGNREDTVNYLVNGINLNDLINNILTLSPPIGSVQEFRIDNSTFSAEFGRNSGAIVNMATRSGTNDFHGELFEYFRNDALDARNFFDFNSSEAQPFKRNQFGGSVGGPIFFPRFGESSEALYSGRNRTFFYFTYEGLSQRQAFSLNSIVLSDQQRSSVSDPIIRRLIELMPRANLVDSGGTARFVGATSAYVNVDQWALDISHSLSKDDQLHFYYTSQNDDRNEPTLGGNTLPGFGDIRVNRKQLLTFNETHVINNATVNEARFGFNRFRFAGTSRAALNPADLGINNGVSQPIGLPQINVTGAFNFGGPRVTPQGRDDTTVVVSDTLSRFSGRHSIKIGGELRHFYSDFFMTDPGIFNFASIPAFLAGNANSFSVTVGDNSSKITQQALELFVLDNFEWKPNVTLELGLRYAWNMKPKEKLDRFVVFDPATASLLRVGTDIAEAYRSNWKNLQPRIGIAWDPFKDGKTSVRVAYALMTEQPMTNAVLNLTTNPPLATPVTLTGVVRLENALTLAVPAGLAPVTIDHDYNNAYVQTWNLNLQREVLRDLIVSAGYFGSKGSHLRISRNINQPVNGVRPFPRLSASSPVLPSVALGNITYIEGSGNSSYNALWTSANMRTQRGLQLSASYTWSKSIDNNSYSSPVTVITLQNSYDIRADRGLSDFDARHRFVLSTIYDLPFSGNQFVAGWSIGAILQMQTGNPLNIVTGNSTVSGVANSIRPDVAGPVEITGSVENWFDTRPFTAVNRFGNLGRNVIIGPGFHNVDLSILKTTKLTETIKLQFRAEVFNLLNRPNFGQPGRVVGTPAFGRITNTRFPTGDTGSSRQVQFALKVTF